MLSFLHARYMVDVGSCCRCYFDSKIFPVRAQQLLSCVPVQLTQTPPVVTGQQLPYKGCSRLRNQKTQGNMAKNTGNENYIRPAACAFFRNRFANVFDVAASEVPPSEPVCTLGFAATPAFLSLHAASPSEGGEASNDQVTVVAGFDTGGVSVMRTRRQTGRKGLCFSEGACRPSLCSSAGVCCSVPRCGEDIDVGVSSLSGS